MVLSFSAKNIWVLASMWHISEDLGDLLNYVVNGTWLHASDLLSELHGPEPTLLVFSSDLGPSGHVVHSFGFGEFPCIMARPLSASSSAAFLPPLVHSRLWYKMASLPQQK